MDYIGGIRFQVAEIVKLCVIITIAYMIQKYSNKHNRIKLAVYIWALGGVMALLLKVISNDLSSSIVILLITFAMSFIFTRTIPLHLIVAIPTVTAVVAYVVYMWNNLPTEQELEHMSFRVARVAAWLKPENYATDASYQTLQSLYAIGRGGFFGNGLGNSIQKITAIPESQNDMIFSIICEELGLFGAAIMIFLFMYLLWHILRVSYGANNLFGSAIATGILLHIGIQVFMNIAVNVNAMPNTGIPLPFISYGGTAVLCLLVELAIVLSIDRNINQ